MEKMKSTLMILLTAIFLVAFSATAFATPPNSSAGTTSASITPYYISPNPPYPGYTGWCIVTAQPSLNVRSGPGPNYPIIGSVLYGDSVYVVYVDSNGWAEISGSDGYGWVLASYLTIQG